MGIELKLAYHCLEDVASLFSQYTSMLIDTNPEVAVCLMGQGYEEELAQLEERYGCPSGRIYTAYCDDVLAGCIALKRLDAQTCEMKRLFVRPEFRGKHLGKQLIETILSDAKEIGYSSMVLDTLLFLEDAIRMYRSYGFYEIAPYNDTSISDTIYMKLDL